MRDLQTPPAPFPPTNIFALSGTMGKEGDWELGGDNAMKEEPLYLNQKLRRAHE